MGFLTDRRGAFSWFRFSLLVIAVGGVFLLFGFISFQLDQQSRRSPFFPDLPNGAQQWGIPTPLTVTSQKVYYRVSGGNVDEIATFYNKKLSEFYGVSEDTGTTAEKCLRNPPTGAYTNDPNAQRVTDGSQFFDETFIPGQSIPYQFDCMFSRSGVNIFQSTQVTIYDGLPSADPNLNSEGSVVIVYEQRWSK